MVTRRPVNSIVMRLLQIIATILFACSIAVHSQTVASADWQTIDADGLFTFCLPKGFVKTDMMGVENYLGEYYRGQTRFLFVWHDTGSYDYDEHLIRNLVEVSTTIDGKRASIRTFSVTRDRIPLYVAELNVGDWRNGKAELYMCLESANPGEVPTAKQIFTSTKFSKRRRA
jgi:hypothetical protein